MAENYHGVNLHINETFGMKVEGSDIYLHPKYEIFTRQVITEMLRTRIDPSAWKDGRSEEREELTESNILKHLGHLK